MTFPKPFYRFRPHPWHGLDAGEGAPEVVRAYIELTPFDTVKYEVDKVTGYTKVDRPQHTSSQCPTLYGFVPRTFCGSRVAALAEGVDKADGDPLDICVVSERPINRADVVLRARVLGGLNMIDREEADDKIIAVLVGDLFWGAAQEIGDLPPRLVERLVHYFTTYKLAPGATNEVRIDAPYGRDHAMAVIAASMADYAETYGSE
ncbi:MAG: inorganic pyrophosphatase [Myxococcota bacterium]